MAIQPPTGIVTSNAVCSSTDTVLPLYFCSVFSHDLNPLKQKAPRLASGGFNVASIIYYRGKVLPHQELVNLTLA